MLHFFVFETEMEGREDMRNATTRSLPPQISESRTTRLDVAAFLLVRGFQISHVEFVVTTATFVFEDSEQRAEATIREFYNGGQVVASEYADAQKRIRDLMWEAKRRVTA
jgi:Domain of unknown function (DUF5659)